MSWTCTTAGIFQECVSCAANRRELRSEARGQPSADENACHQLALPGCSRDDKIMCLCVYSRVGASYVGRPICVCLQPSQRASDPFAAQTSGLAAAACSFTEWLVWSGRHRLRRLRVLLRYPGGVTRARSRCVASLRSNCRHRVARLGGAFVFGWSRLLPLLRRQGDVPKGKRARRKFSEHRVLSRICGVWSCGRLAARGTRRGPVGLGVSRSLCRGRTDVYGPVQPDAALRNMPRMLRGCMPRMHACQGVVKYKR